MNLTNESTKINRVSAGLPVYFTTSCSTDEVVLNHEIYLELDICFSCQELFIHRIKHSKADLQTSSHSQKCPSIDPGSH